MRELHYGVNQRCRGRVLEDIAYVIIVHGRPDRNISDTRKVVEVMPRGRKIDRESLKMAHQNDPGQEPVSPTDF